MDDLSELNQFAKRYTKAWCSQDPESVAACYAEHGSLRVNDEASVVGRSAIAELARGFMSMFPDMELFMDGVVREPRGTVFHWTLTGTNTGPGGTGKCVRISGNELWQLDNEGLVANSKGSFDKAEYERQLKRGVDA